MTLRFITLLLKIRIFTILFDNGTAGKFKLIIEACLLTPIIRVF